MKKKIIFLDGDGTLWYPKKTKRSEKPHWVYDHPETKDNYLGHLELTPETKETLEKLKEKGIYLVVISANPRAEHLAVLEIKERLEHFGITSYFYSVRSSLGNDPKGKAGVMLEVLKTLNLQKEDALMIGDSFNYDYLAAKEVGIDALWIENPVSKLPDALPKDLQKIREVSEVLDLLKVLDQPIIYLLCGLPGSGKTHFAKNLENVNTVRFTLDEEFFKKFGKDYDKTKYAEFEENLKEEILEKSKQLVKENKNVILDFGFWKKKDREVIKTMFEKLGGEVKLIFFDITKETRYKRVFGREKDGQHYLNLEALEKFEKEFEEPKNEKEGLFTEAGILFEHCQVLNNEKHFLIKTQREGISAIYLSEDKNKILRIGEKTKIEKDLTNHKKLLSQGYPVSEILEEGIVGEFSYFIEKSLGEKLFGEIFADDYEKQGNISDDNIDLLIEESKKLLTAHINNSVLENRFAETVTGLHVDWLINELPELKEKILKRLEFAQEKLKVFPFVFSHGDYNPYNIFPDGVIDFEDGFYAPIIFDIYGLFVYPIHFPLKKDIELEINGRYRYTETQRIKYFTEMDKILLEHGLPKGNDFFEEIKFLKGIWLAVRMQKWPKMQEYRYKMFGELL